MPELSSDLQLLSSSLTEKYGCLLTGSSSRKQLSLTEKRAQQRKHLLHKCENLRLNLQHPLRLGA
ncbi:hypothetical protein LEMLEM_LOCUS16152, partial [Lemmus lemmus]